VEAESKLGKVCDIGRYGARVKKVNFKQHDNWYLVFGV